MAEEFQESDVLWPKKSSRNERCRSVFQDENINPADYKDSFAASASLQYSNQFQSKKMKKGKSCHSLPVTIPCSRANTTSYDKNNSSEDYCSDSTSEVAEMVPPHLLVAGRSTRQMAFSVCSGNGRTLKGRDLSRVRDSILRMTGFIET